jgi:GAF domain-containing protein
MFGVINKICEFLDTDTFLKKTTKEVSRLIKSDRVSVYKFNTDWGGEFVGHFVATSSNYLDESKLGINTMWNDTYLQETKGGRYRNNKTYAVDDIYKMGFTPCHVDKLKQFQIYAFVLAPIFIRKKLWGLLCTYQHAGPRQWTTSEVNSISQFAGQLGVAIQKTELLVKTQQQAE